METAERAEWLRALGCRYMQGDYFSPPVPADRVEECLAARPWAEPEQYSTTGL
ncbi:hypothetical protein GCM10020369_42390 [Cryptosporangium minutisporangium]|uniref:EAL domain-containing protein n=1 Tax=Cryptosporangium minutisporangium TaxID=113569 RepID=A0ABP6T2N0_9ACTN